MIISDYWEMLYQFDQGLTSDVPDLRKTTEDNRIEDYNFDRVDFFGRKASSG